MANIYPPLGFHFKVAFNGIESEDADNRFQSVAGLSVDLQSETIREGGENRFEHVLPTFSKYQNLTLKRGLVKDSAVINWMLDAIQNLAVDPIDIDILLLNQDHESLQAWNIVHAWPVKWNVTDFNAEESKIVIETMELTYHYFTTE